MSQSDRLHDPERLIAGTSHAIERARARGAETVEPDDLLAGLLLAVARFGIVDLGAVAIDLAGLGLAFDPIVPDTTLKPRFPPASVAAFDRAARTARADGAPRIEPIHLLVALADPALPTFARLCAGCGIDAAGWRRLLAAMPPPSRGTTSAAASPGRDDAAAAPAIDALMTPEEAARALGVHIQTLRGYIRWGKLPAYRVAGERAIRIRRDDLSALLEHLRVAPASAESRPVSRDAGP